MDFIIEVAKQVQARAKIAFIGPAGAGKTYTALITARELGDKTLVIDTENKSSVKYANQFNFDVLALPDYKIETYIKALEFAAGKSYDVVIVDSLSHAWAGKGGALEQAEMAGKKYGGNKFAGWADVTPLQNQLIDTILKYPAHLIATMRMKIEYALITDESGKQKPQKLGLGVIQRDSVEYEFDVVGQMDVDHNLAITKTRCFQLDGFMARKPDGEMGRIIRAWLDSGAEALPSFTTLDGLLFQLHTDFGLSEQEAKAKLKKLGFTTLPKNGGLRQRLEEMYQAVKAAQAQPTEQPNDTGKIPF